MIHVGTSGYSYTEWRGVFYPNSMDKEAFLAFYAGHFTACEINFSYYRMPTREICESLVEKSEKRVIFTVKAHHSITHDRENIRENAAAFIDGLEPLCAANVLGAVLIQFPFSFRLSSQGKRVLAAVIDAFERVPSIIEFRNETWLADAVLDYLAKRSVGFCCVDEPRLKGLLPPIAQVTSKDIAYVRFHGRNAENWWNPPQAAMRYDYLYSEAELREWIPKIRDMEKRSTTVFVFLNNHFAGKAVQNAFQLMKLLGIEPSGSSPRQMSLDL